MPRKIEISHKTVIFTVVFLLLLGFIYLIRDVILSFFVALLIMAILNPTVSKLSKYKIPRPVSILVVYLVGLGLLGVTLAVVVPPLIEQTTSFVNSLPVLVDRLGIPAVISEQIVSELISQIGTLPGQVAKVVLSIFSNVIGVVMVLIFAFYLLLARDKLDEHLGSLFDNKRRKKIGKLIDLLEKRLGGWARAQLVLMFVVGFSIYLGLRLLAIPFALPLSILAGLLEIVPYIGPVIAAIPAVFIGFGISPVIGLATAALTFLVQQFENYIFVPKIMESSAGVSPVVTLLALAIGFRLAGMVGVLISIPVFITLQVIAREYFRRQ